MRTAEAGLIRPTGVGLIRTAGLTLATAILLVGCDASGGADAGAVVADSAGVRIVVNDAPAWSPDEGWHLEDPPRTRIGAVEGETPYLFDRVMGAVTLSDGRIAVADMGSSQVRFFDRDGRHLFSVGGQGEGPEEFRTITGVLPLPGDALGVVDRYERVQVLDADGRYGARISTGAIGGPVEPFTYHLNPPRPFEVIGALDGGGLVGREASPLTLSPTPAREFEAPERNELRFVSYAVEGGELREPAEIVQIEGPTFHPHPENLVLRAVFGPEAFAATHGGSLVLGLPEHREVRWYREDGTIETIARLRWPARRVTEQMVEEYVERSSPPLPEALARGRTFAEELAPFSEMRVDHGGNVWLRKSDPGHATTVAQYLPTFDAPSTWAVISPDGRWLGDVRLPPSLHVIEVGEDHLLALYRDDFDVEYLRIYELRKP